MAKRRVVLVDDHPLFRRVLAGVLRTGDGGMQVCLLIGKGLLNKQIAFELDIT